MKTLQLFVFWSLFLFIQGCNAGGRHLQHDDRIIGIKVYKIEGDLTASFEDWKDHGINTVFADASLLTEEFRTLAKKNDIRIFIILPIFFNPESLQKDPDLYAITDRGERAVKEWVEFICPSRMEYREERIAYIKQLITDLDPDGISLDFIRHFAYWEKIYPETDPDSIPESCFDASCINAFKLHSGIVIPDSQEEVPDLAEWINVNCREEWTDWKCGLITSFVETASREAKQLNNDILINVHAIPWRKEDFNDAARRITGQDFRDIARHVDMISPMCYAHMVKRSPEWIHSVVSDLSARVDIPVYPSIQVNRAYLEEPLSLEEFKQSLQEALKPPSGGVIFWSWEQLMESPEKKELLRIYCSDTAIR